MSAALGQQVGIQREQTMEEILASIRKIIESNEGGQADGTASETQPQPVLRAVDQEALRAKNGQRVVEFSGEPRSSEQKPERSAQPMREREIVTAVAEPVVAPPVPAQAVAAGPRLVSEDPEKRVAAAFEDLNSAFLKSKNRSLEDVAESMLRPMLQDWLDNNLPSLVERLVREEIARIARGDI